MDFFFPFYPLITQKIKIWKKLRKTPGGIIILHKWSHKSWSYAILFLRYGMWQMQFLFFIWVIFYPPINENLKKMKKKNAWGYRHCTQMYQKSWFILGSFLLFYPLTAQKTKISQKWKIHLEISSFYTSAPKIMIIYYTILLLRYGTWDVIVGSFHVKSPKPPYLNPMDFVEILSGECIHQEMKILKMLSLYHVRFRNYDHLKYGTFSLDTEPLKFLAFWNCFYLAAIFNRKQLKFGLAIHFHTIISKTMYLTKNFIKKVCGGV